MEKNGLIQLSEVMAPMQFCPAGCDHGGGCSRKRDHDGNHQSVGRAGQVYCEWTQEGEEVPAGPKYPDA